MKVLKKIILPLFVICFSYSSLAESKFEFYYPSSANSGKNIPLVLLLHGCTQSAQDMLELTQIKDLAEKEKFAVLLPEQSTKRNQIKCWNWFVPKNQQRYGTEPLEIMSAVFQVVSNNAIDKDKVYVAGLSAGGAMAGILASYWSDFFKAVAIHSSASFKRAASAAEAVNLLRNGPEPKQKDDPETPACSFRALPLMVLQGGADKVVHPTNAIALVEDLGGCEPDKTKLYTDVDLDHAWSGGAADKKYSHPKGADASKMIWDFFKQY